MRDAWNHSSRDMGGQVCLISRPFKSIPRPDEGTDYQVMPGAVECGFQAGWPALRLVLDHAHQKLTREDILAEWLIQHRKPKAATLWRWLSRGVELVQLVCEGAGHRSDPLRYWLPEREQVWKQDAIFCLLERQRSDLNLPFVSLNESRNVRERKTRRAGWRGEVEMRLGGI